MIRKSYAKQLWTAVGWILRMTNILLVTSQDAVLGKIKLEKIKLINHAALEVSPMEMIVPVPLACGLERRQWIRLWIRLEAWDYFSVSQRLSAFVWRFDFGIRRTLVQILPHFCDKQKQVSTTVILTNDSHSIKLLYLTLQRCQKMQQVRKKSKLFRLINLDNVECCGLGRRLVDYSSFGWKTSVSVMKNWQINTKRLS